MMKAEPACALDEVRSQLASVGTLSDLPGYPSKVLATLDILESHGLSQQPLMAQ